MEFVLYKTQLDVCFSGHLVALTKETLKRVQPLGKCLNNQTSSTNDIFHCCSPATVSSVGRKIKAQKG